MDFPSLLPPLPPPLSACFEVFSLWLFFPDMVLAPSQTGSASGVCVSHQKSPRAAPGLTSLTCLRGSRVPGLGDGLYKQLQCKALKKSYC